MHELSVYKIHVKGLLEEQSFNMNSPFQISVEESGGAETIFKVFADQSGMVGLIRFLHREGLLILNVNRQE